MTNLEQLTKKHIGHLLPVTYDENGHYDEPALLEYFAAIVEAVEGLIGDDEVLEPYKEWHKKTKPYGGTREEWERLYDITNNENNFRARLRQAIKEWQ